MGDLESYEECVRKLRNRGKQWDISNEDINKIIDKSFRFLDLDTQSNRKTNSKSAYRTLSLTLLLVSVFFILLIMIQYRKVAHNLIERNIQECIYPAMKFLRKVMLPVVKSFPSVTEWYDEACLVSNPYFKVSDIDCWPCEQVRSVLNLTLSNLDNNEFHSGIPFIVKDPDIKKVDFKKLRSVYHAKKTMFDRDAPKIEHSHGKMLSAEELFQFNSFYEHPTENRDTHATWKLNRLEPTREIRLLFGMPSRVPNYIAGATPEKYILIDEHKSPYYYLPSTEGTNVFVIQGCGARLFILEPSKECLQSCHRVSVLLKPKHILWYNWWYWRAISIPVNHSSRVSITYFGSYY